MLTNQIQAVLDSLQQDIAKVHYDAAFGGAPAGVAPASPMLSAPQITIQLEQPSIAGWVFAHDVVAAGRTIRVLSVVDAFTPECMALEVDTGFASRRVTRVLDEVIARRGLPQAISCDNGPELTSRHFLAWCLEWKIELRHIQPGRPTQNGHVESFHGKLRDECLRTN